MKIAQPSKLLGSSRKLRQELEAMERALHTSTRELEDAREELAAQEEEKLRLETRLRLLEKAVETVSLGVTITDMQGKIIYVNAADARMHGYSVDELIGKEARMYSAKATHPEDYDDPAEPWARQRLDATKDGLSFPVRLISDRVRDHQHEPMGTVTICEDIREREHIREALSRRDNILKAVGLAAERLLTDASWEESVEEILERLGTATGVDLIYMSVVKDESPFTTGSVILSWTTPGGVVEDRFGSGLGLPDRVELFTCWKERLQSGQTLQGRVRELPADERTILEAWGVRSFLVVPIFVDSKLRGYLSLEDGDDNREWLSAEIEALKTAARTFGASIQTRQAELALAMSEEKYRDLLENATDLILSVSPDGRFQYVNRAWKDSLGYNDDEVQKLKLWDVVRSHHPASEHDVVNSILSGDGGGRLEAIFVTRDGTEISVEGTINSRFVDGLPVATRGVFRDITERKIVDRMKQEFISMVSHELRTPLTSIIASLGLLDSGRMSGDPQRVQELVAVALRNSNRLLRLINNLLDQQKLADGKMSFYLEPVEITPIIQETVDDVRSYADMLNIELRFESQGEDLYVMGDRDRLGQVLNNLLSNAIKFSPPSDVVTLSLRSARDRVIISVADNGPGIPQEFRDRLFEKFTQFDASVTRRSGGSGLGLSIARGLAEGMNGRIVLDTAVSQGATFRIEMPPARKPTEV
ncbi:MAG: PAS domain S-box protein [bacterium]|nr:PAS domain S-box protein [bacterium]